MKTLLKRRSKAVMKKKNLLRKREWVVGKRQLKKKMKNQKRKVLRLIASFRKKDIY